MIMKNLNNSSYQKLVYQMSLLHLQYPLKDTYQMYDKMLGIFMLKDNM